MLVPDDVGCISERSQTDTVVLSGAMCAIAIVANLVVDSLAAG